MHVSVCKWLGRGRPFDLKVLRVQIGVSVGISIYPDHARDHGKRIDGKSCPGQIEHRYTESGRGTDIDRRLRNRLLLAIVSEAHPGARIQDRSRFRIRYAR